MVLNSLKIHVINQYNFHSRRLKGIENIKKNQYNIEWNVDKVTTILVVFKWLSSKKSSKTCTKSKRD